MQYSLWLMTPKSNNQPEDQFQESEGRHKLCPGSLPQQNQTATATMVERRWFERSSSFLVNFSVAQDFWSDVLYGSKWTRKKCFSSDQITERRGSSMQLATLNEWKMTSIKNYPIIK